VVKNIVRKKLCYMYSGKQTLGVSWRRRFWTTLRKGDARGSSFSEKHHPKHFKVILLKQKQKVRVIHLGKFHEWLATHLGDAFLSSSVDESRPWGWGRGRVPIKTTSDQKRPTLSDMYPWNVPLFSSQTGETLILHAALMRPLVRIRTDDNYVSDHPKCQA